MYEVIRNYYGVYLVKKETMTNFWGNAIEGNLIIRETTPLDDLDEREKEYRKMADDFNSIIAELHEWKNKNGL